jgi:oligoribonuclease NrnB/cAMP/cGMP phosphodiesterase (DHH superfamily)
MRLVAMIFETLITHGGGCADGSCSAILALNVFPKINIKFLEHNSLEHINLRPEKNMIFIDFAPHPSNVQAFVDAGAFVLDHHKYSKDIVSQFGDRGVFADEKEDIGVSGGVLAYEFWKNYFERSCKHLAEKMSKFVGIRDTWQRQDPDFEESCKINFTISFFPQDYFKTHYDIGEIFRFSEEIGPILIEKKKSDVLVAQKNGLSTSVNKAGKEVDIFITDRKDLVSDLSEKISQGLCFGFGYSFADEPSITVSCRSRSDFDVGKLAKFYGGGGHSKAAGFKIELKENNKSPHDLVKQHLQNYIDFMDKNNK